MAPRRVRRGWLKHHHRTDIDLNTGRIIPITGKNVWERIQRSPRKYVLDTHWPLEECLGHPEYLRDSFILGTTRLNEQSELIRLFIDSKGRKKIGKNVFLFGVNESVGTLERLDEWFLSTMDINKLLTTGDLNSPASKFILPSPTEVQQEVLVLQFEIRRELFGILCREKTARKPLEATYTNQLLYRNIRSQISNCFASLEISGIVARWAFALLLINSHKARSNFLKKGPTNGFYDAAIIGNALFFGAEVLSLDEGVHEMGRYCGVKVRRNLPRTPD